MKKHRNLLGAALCMVEAASKKDSEPRKKSSIFHFSHSFPEYSNWDTVAI